MHDEGSEMRDGGDQLRLVPSREQELAWAAGLFEGEGTWNAYGYKNKAKRSVQARLAMTDRDVVERFAAAMGFGTIVARKVREDRPREKPVFEWYTQKRANVRQMIEWFWPFLGERRRSRAEALIALGPAKPSNERTHCPKGHAYEGDNLMLDKKKHGAKTYVIRRCRICRTEQSRERARKRLGVQPENYRV